jgi:hypothetical protein
VCEHAHTTACSITLQENRRGTIERLFSELEMTKDEHLEHCFFLACSLRGNLIEQRTAAGLLADGYQDLLVGVVVVLLVRSFYYNGALVLALQYVSSQRPRRRPQIDIGAFYRQRYEVGQYLLLRTGLTASGSLKVS